MKNREWGPGNVCRIISDRLNLLPEYKTPLGNRISDMLRAAHYYVSTIPNDKFTLVLFTPRASSDSGVTISVIPLEEIFFRVDWSLSGIPEDVLRDLKHFILMEAL